MGCDGVSPDSQHTITYLQVLHHLPSLCHVAWPLLPAIRAMMEEYKCKLLQTLVHLVMEEVGKIPVLHRTARTKQHQFSIDICLIAFGVRQVCLYPQTSL